ncbi:hypothetical protein Scep_018209 [Stephania cephalantha]|uniref:Uncharacterized protein n=1 Tax=Stephania cephalantha TaxID=152367 RepID=A0AAP0NXP1_9MAGN
MQLHVWNELLRREKPLQQPLKEWKSIGGLQYLVLTLSLRLFENGCLNPPCQLSSKKIQSRMLTLSPTDSVLTATKKMLEFRVSSAVVTVENKPRGILTSKDILMRVIAQNLPPDSTTVEKVMTPNPECATVDTPIVDALHTMHDGKFLHLPVVDRDGTVVSVVDVIHITHAAVATVGNSGVGNEAASTMMQKFWDSALTLGPLSDDDETRSEGSLKLASEGTDTGRSLSYPSSSLPHTFGFKIQDNKGRMHRFNCDTRNLTELITSILQRVGDDIDRNRLPQIMYEDEDHDKVMLASDGDLAAAVDHARQAGWKGLRLHLDYSRPGDRHSGSSLDYAHRDAWAAAYSTVAAGAALIAGLGVLAYLKRSSS